MSRPHRPFHFRVSLAIVCLSSLWAVVFWASHTDPQRGLFVFAWMVCVASAVVDWYGYGSS